MFWTVEPTQDGDRQFTVRRKGDVQIVAVAYHVPSSLHDDSDALGFAGFILGQVPTGRLHKELVEKGLAAQVFAFPLMGHDPGLQIFGAVVKKDAPSSRCATRWRRSSRASATPRPAHEEMERTRIATANDIEKTLANHEAIGVQLSEYIALGDWRLFFLARDRLPTVKPEDVARVSKAYFRRDNRTVGHVPARGQPAALRGPCRAAGGAGDEGLQGAVGRRAGRGVRPVAGQHRRAHQAAAVRPGEGGAARQEEPRRDGERRDQPAPRQRGGAARPARELVVRRAHALARHDQATRAAELSDEFERLKVSGRVAGPGASFQTTRPNLAAALKLAVHVLKEPRFDPAEFEQLRTQTITGIQSQLSEPDARAGDEMEKIFNVYAKDDWRYQPTLEEALDETRAVKLDAAKRSTTEFYGADPAEIAIVGDFDEAEVTAALLKELFANWEPQGAVHARGERVPRHPGRGAQGRDARTRRTPSSSRARTSTCATTTPTIRRSTSPTTSSAAARASTRASRRASARRKACRTAWARSSAWARSTATAAWSAYAIAAPQNVAKVESAFREEIARAVKDGFTQKELAAAKSGILQIRAQNRAQDRALAGAWAGNLYLGRTFAFSRQFEDKVTALTLEDVNAALRKHLDPAKISIVEAGDFRKAGEPAKK